MTEFFEEEINRIAAELTDIGTITVLNVPPLPAVNDATHRITVLGYQGLIEDMEPKKEQSNSTLKDYR